VGSSSAVTACLHSLGSRRELGIFPLVWHIAVEQLLPFNRALCRLFHKSVDVIDIVIRFQLNLGKHLELQSMSIQVVAKNLDRSL